MEPEFIVRNRVYAPGNIIDNENKSSYVQKINIIEYNFSLTPSEYRGDVFNGLCRAYILSSEKGSLIVIKAKEKKEYPVLLDLSNSRDLHALFTVISEIHERYDISMDLFTLLNFNSIPCMRKRCWELLRVASTQNQRYKDQISGYLVKTVLQCVVIDDDTLSEEDIHHITGDIIFLIEKGFISLKTFSGRTQLKIKQAFVITRLKRYKRIHKTMMEDIKKTIDSYEDTRVKRRKILHEI